MDLVTIAEFPSSIEASMAMNRLRDEDIDAVLADEAIGDLFHLSANFGEVKVQVPEDQAERARAILDEIKHVENDSDNESVGSDS